MQGIHISNTIECGQVFRYEKLAQSEYLVRAMSESCVVSQDRYGGIRFRDSTIDTSFWIEYFDIQNKKFYDRAVELCVNSENDILKSAAEKYQGTYILKQDPWEALISFIISQNNNIPKIKTTINKLCEACCGSLDKFPSAEDILNADKLTKLDDISLGYRKNYLVLASQAHIDGRVNVYKLASVKNYGTHMKDLKSITGVGDKVANCVCLFGFRDMNAVPEDVWIKRLYEKYPDIDLKKFGEYAGVIQQYLYQYIRDDVGDE